MCKGLQLSSAKVISAHDLKAGCAADSLKNEYINKQITEKLTNATNPSYFPVWYSFSFLFFFFARADISALAFFTSSF